MISSRTKAALAVAKAHSMKVATPGPAYGREQEPTGNRS